MPTRQLVGILAAAITAVLLTVAGPAAATPTDDPLKDLPSRVDTSPDRMRFVRTGAVVAAVALIVVAGAVLTGRDDD